MQYKIFESIVIQVLQKRSFGGRGNPFHANEHTRGGGGSKYRSSIISFAADIVCLMYPYIIIIFFFTGAEVHVQFFVVLF